LAGPLTEVLRNGRDPRKSPIPKLSRLATPIAFALKEEARAPHEAGEPITDDALREA